MEMTVRVSLSNMETYFVKIAGKVNVPSKVSIGHNFKLTMDCSVTQESKEDNEDGTFNVISKLVPITAEIVKDNGEIIKARDPRKNSTKVRNLLHWKWQQSNNPQDFEEYYTKFTNYVLANMDTVISQLK